MILDRIKELCLNHETTIKQLEINTGIANGVIRKWDTVSPRLEYVVRVANYFGVSVDYLLCRQEASQSENVNNADATRSEAEQKVVDLYNSMPPEMQKAAIAQLEALAALNKK